MKHEKDIQRLGYTSQWLEFGIITYEYLLKQYIEINNSEDDNAEHYRCAAFTDYLKNKNNLTDQELDNIFHLKDDGPDGCILHTCRIIELLYSNLLSDSQLLSISKYSEVQENPINNCYLRTILKRKIKKQGLSDDVFEEVKKTKDFTIHDYVLEHPDLTKEHISWFMEHGNNKRIRNIAKQLANKKKYKR